MEKAAAHSYGKRLRCAGAEDDQSELPLKRGVFFYPVMPAFVVSDALEPDFPIIYVNTIFEIFTGYRADEVLGRNCMYLLLPTMMEELKTLENYKIGESVDLTEGNSCWIQKDLQDLVVITERQSLLLQRVILRVGY